MRSLFVAFFFSSCPHLCLPPAALMVLAYPVVALMDARLVASIAQPQSFTPVLTAANSAAFVKFNEYNFDGDTIFQAVRP